MVVIHRIYAYGNQMKILLKGTQHVFITEKDVLFFKHTKHMNFIVRHRTGADPYVHFFVFEIRLKFVKNISTCPI